MKKLFAVIAVVVMMLVVGSAYAVDNQPVKLSVEPYADLVLSHKVEQDNMSVNLSQGWYGAKVNITLLDRLTISPFLAGVGTGGKLEGDKLDTDNALGYGVGAKLDLPLNLPVDIALLSMIRATSTDLNKVGDYELSSDKDLDMLEYEFEVQVSKALEIPNIPGKITPIIGVRYSDLKINGNPDGADVNLKAKTNIGMTVGAKYDINDTFGVSIKSKFIDQTAIEVAGIVRF